MADKSTTTPQVIDFTNVKDGGQGFNKRRVPAGDYSAKITAVVDAPSKKDGVFQWCFTIDLPEGGTYPYYCKLQENQLWKLRNLFIAAGLNVPKKRVKVDPTRVVGKIIAVTMEDDEYDGKAQSNIAAVFPAADLQDDAVDEEADDEYEDEEEEEPAPAPKRKAKAAPVVEEEDEEEEEEEEEEEPAPPVRKKRSATKAPARKSTAAVTDDELEELDIEGI